MYVVNLKKAICVLHDIRVEVLCLFEAFRIFNRSHPAVGFLSLWAFWFLVSYFWLLLFPLCLCGLRSWRARQARPGGSELLGITLVPH